MDLQQLNKAAGTQFVDWKEAVDALKKAFPEPLPELQLEFCECECGCRAFLGKDFVFKIPVCEVCSMNVHMAKEEAI